MVNYGYTCKDWSDAEKWELASALKVLLNSEKWKDAYNMYPYIETDMEDGLYWGVRIRRITHLEPKVQEELVREADKIKIEFDKRRKKGA